ncbi:AT-rich interactive domain-containing protein 2 [Acorus calamus]|uniref:AT-rich interactive domain-containing protein 2 n=1 Tax=Acorus calamus TaxID=4465 RepID=A0AAV9C6D7_ACOCL|nr:AT-rich interactive domain-containing protein 2 [Acorus calamus]
MEECPVVTAARSPPSATSSSAAAAEILAKLKSVGACSDLDLSAEAVEASSPFDRVVSAFLGGTRPIPPMLGDGRVVDLLRLYLAVKERGGHDAVNESGSWTAVAQAIGLEPVVAPSVKLIYLKYLDMMERRLEEVAGERETGTEGNGGETLKIKGSSDSDESPSLKRKRQSAIMEMLRWSRRLAVAPGKLYMERRTNGNDGFIERVLMMRKVLYLKKLPCVPSERYLVQKRQKTHPSWYEDATGSDSPALRCSSRLQSKQILSNSCSSSETSGADDKPKLHGNVSGDTFNGNFSTDDPEKEVPVGHHYQAEIPDYVDIPSHGSNDPDDLKWLGTMIWPPTKKVNNLEVQDDSIGKGRPNSCSCKHPGSVRCIKFHVAEERLRLKLELGSVFSIWKFENMGEEVALSWTASEQAKFKDIVRSNRASLGEDFWDEVYQCFPEKSRQSIVSYYFNAFVLWRRAYQNRITPHEINSDDDESEFGMVGDSFACDKEYFCTENTQCMDLVEFTDTERG